MTKSPFEIRTYQKINVGDIIKIGNGMFEAKITSRVTREDPVTRLDYSTHYAEIMKHKYRFPMQVEAKHFEARRNEKEDKLIARWHLQSEDTAAATHFMDFIVEMQLGVEFPEVKLWAGPDRGIISIWNSASMSKHHATEGLHGFVFGENQMLEARAFVMNDYYEDLIRLAPMSPNAWGLLVELFPEWMRL